MRLTIETEQTGVETKVSTPYDVASYLAYSKGFKTLKQYTDYVVENKMAGFLPDPTKYPQYTTAWNFLRTSRSNYYKNRNKIVLSKRNQAEITRKRVETMKRNKAIRLAELQSAPQAVKVARPTTFSAEQVVDILIQSEVSIAHIAQFIDTHRVSEAYALKVLLGMLKNKVQVPATV